MPVRAIMIAVIIAWINHVPVTNEAGWEKKWHAGLPIVYLLGTDSRIPYNTTSEDLRNTSFNVDAECHHCE